MTRCMRGSEAFPVYNRPLLADGGVRLVGGAQQCSRDENIRQFVVALLLFVRTVTRISGWPRRTRLEQSNDCLVLIVLGTGVTSEVPAI